MPVPQNKTNFKTYEASTRLLAAVLASINGKVKLNFNDLAALMGGGTTGSAVDHRLRPVKQLAKMQVQWLKKNKDPGELPVDTGEIQKLFGESTAAGIEWQFREIKALGRAQQQAVEEGKNPAELKLGTPSRAKSSAASTPGSRGVRTPSTAGGSKRKRAGPISKKMVTMSEESSSNENTSSDYDAKDVNTSIDVDIEADDDDDVQITPTPKRRNFDAPASSDVTKTGRTPLPLPLSARKNGVSRSLFGNGAKTTSPAQAPATAPATAPAANGNGTIEVVDLSDDDPPAPKTAPRNTHVKAELGLEEDTLVTQGGRDSFSHGVAFEDDYELADGEA